jgi:nucleoside-diphosphate-sugar epimerase
MTHPIAGRRIALIGGAGFIGHNMALEMKRLGADVHVIDGLAVNNLLSLTSNADNVPTPELYLRHVRERLELLRRAGIELTVLDARDYHALSNQLGRIKPQIIVHLAAVAHANRANKNPFSTFDHSARTLENALDAARGQVEHFIYFSSSMVYGNFQGDSVTEEDPCEPLGIYGALKLGGEKIVIAYNQVFDLPFTIVRPSALYGERCVSRRVGQVFIENALSGKDIVISGDGSERLDFTYVGDVAAGVIKIICEPTARNQIFNLTYGRGRSLDEMVEILRRYFPDINVRYEPRDRLMPERGTLIVDKARRLAGYEPAFPLEAGFARYIEWYQSIWPDYLRSRSAP